MSRESRVFKTQAVILKRSDFGEADRLLTLLTPEYGKIRAIGRGIRRPQAKAAGHVELYAVTEFMLARGRSLNIVTQAELLQPFLPLQHDLKRMAYASLFAELMDRFAVDEQESRIAYHLLVDGLNWLCENKVNLTLAARYYELKLLDVMGYAPSFFYCAVTGKPLKAEDQYYSVEAGGVISPAAAQTHQERFLPLPLSVLKILRHFMRHDWTVIRGLQLTPAQELSLERIIHTTLVYLLEQRLQSVDFLRRISSDR